MEAVTNMVGTERSYAIFKWIWGCLICNKWKDIIHKSSSICHSWRKVYGYKTKGKPVKNFQREGLIAMVNQLTALEDSFSNLFLICRLQRRRKALLDSVQKITQSLTHERCERSTKSVAFVSDRGYSRLHSLELIRRLGFPALFIIPDHFRLYTHFWLPHRVK